MEPTVALIAGIIGLAIALTIIVYNTFAWGFVLFKFWSWFVLPVFTTAPHITLAQAMGLMLVISLFHKNSYMKSSYNNIPVKTDIKWGSWVLSPWLTFFFGWVIYSLFI